MPSLRPHMGLLGMAGALVALALGAPAGRAESLPHWKPDQLTLYSDLVVLATQESATELRIEKVLGGKWQGKQIKVPRLAEFRKARGRFGGDRPTAVTARCVVFLKGGRGEKGVVANGVYRVQRDGSVLGYAQDNNPGGYELQAKPVYPSLDALLKAVAAAEAEVPRKQEALLRQIAAEQKLDLLSAHLEELRRIVRPGDKEVLAFIGRQLAGAGTNAQPYLRFLQNLHEPGAYPLLKQYFERTGDLSLLYTIGRQGTPEAREYLAGLVRQGKGEERRRFALEGLATLYGAVERAGDTRARVKVREAIITLYDKDPFVANYVAGHPRILGAIPHPEAIQRLEQILARVRGDGTNRDYEVERVLRECRQKLAQQMKGR